MSGTKKHKRLKVKELTDTLKHLRTYLPKNCIEAVAGLVWHINWLEDDRLSLERELREIRQAELFDKKIIPFEGRVEDPDYTPPPPKTYSSPGERLWTIFREGEEAVAVYMRTHNMNSVQRFTMLKTANEWARANGKDLVS